VDIAGIASAIGDVMNALSALRLRLLADGSWDGKFDPWPAAPDAKHAQHATGRKTQLCRCMHGLEHHPNGGPCTYGHGTAFGGCKCPGWHPTGTRIPKAAKEPKPKSPRQEKREPSNGVTVKRPPAHAAGAPVGDFMIHVPPSTAQKKLLHALAQSNGPMHRRKLALWTGYSPDSGGYGQALADLRADKYIAGDATAIVITEAGRAAAGDVESLPIGRELLRWWCDKRPKGDADILATLSHGRPMSRDDIAYSTGKSATSGGFGQALANLRRLGLIDGPSSAIRIAPELIG
jgi:hypothetical protein